MWTAKVRRMCVSMDPLCSGSLIGPLSQKPPPNRDVGIGTSRRAGTPKSGRTHQPRPCTGAPPPSGRRCDDDVRVRRQSLRESRPPPPPPRLHAILLRLATSSASRPTAASLSSCRRSRSTCSGSVRPTSLRTSANMGLRQSGHRLSPEMRTMARRQPLWKAWPWMHATTVKPVPSPEKGHTYSTFCVGRGQRKAADGALLLLRPLRVAQGSRTWAPARACRGLEAWDTLFVTTSVHHKCYQCKLPYH